MRVTVGDAGVDVGSAIQQQVESGGKAVDNAVDGLKAIAAGEKVDYSGASGPCDFDDIGDILECKFRYEQVKSGKAQLVKLA